MKIELQEIGKLFQQMSEQLLNIESVSIVIFIAVDVDSICTLKMFSKMFKCENIQYKVYPVTTYTQLDNRIEQSKVYDKVKMFMFINCGGLIDLTGLWIAQQMNEAKIFLFDIHKPIHHKNLESQRIKIVDDGKSQYESCPTTEEMDKYEELNQYNLSQSSDQDFDGDQDEKVEGSPKRMKKRQMRQKLKKHKNVIEQKISSYYGQNFFGYPSSYSTYRLMMDIKKSSNQYLWYAIVGMTSMYLQQKISKQILNDIHEFYRGEVSRYNPISNPKREKGEISGKKGYQFTLLDHWSLYESMLYSNYMMIRLHLWEERGLSQLNAFIHYLQISLQDAKQKFKYIPKETQVKLQNNIYSTAEKFKIHDVVFPSFQKQIDFSDSLMASDYFYILTSILESPPKKQISFESLPNHRVDSFWQAYEIFDLNKKQLEPKIEEYKRTQKIIMTETKNIIERDHLISMNNISIANIRNDTDDKKIFEHPSTLIRLAYILMGVLKQKKRSKRFKPFIANWMDLEKQICMIVGVMMDSKNSIGNRFNQVAQRLKIQVNHDNFMANIILIKKDNLSEFIKEIGRS